MATFKRIVINRDTDNNVDLIEELENPIFNEFSELFEDFETEISDNELEEDEEDTVLVYLFYPEEKLICILPDNRVIVDE